MSARDEVLRHYPEAVWFPGDSAPVGQRVLLRADVHGHRRLGEALGLFVPPAPGPAAARHCPTCRCATAYSVDLAGWWLVRDLTRDIMCEPGALPEGGRFVPPGTPGAMPWIVVEYPPGLTPAPTEGT